MSARGRISRISDVQTSPYCRSMLPVADNVAFTRFSSLVMCFRFYIQLYSPECTLAENMNIMLMTSCFHKLVPVSGATHQISIKQWQNSNGKRLRSEIWKRNSYCKL